MHVLEVERLTKAYGPRTVVDAASFTVVRGAVCGFLGPNGSGKTTTLGMVLGTVRPSGGAVRLFGAADPESLRRARRRVGAALELPGLYPDLNAEDNLRVAARLKGTSDASVGPVLELVKLASERRRRVGTFSLGMRQRLSLAAALLGDPDLLVLDEPTNGLDPEGICDLRAVVRDVARRGTTVLLSSHLLREVEAVCTHVVMIARGRVVRQLAISDLARPGALALEAADVGALRDAVAAYRATVRVRVEGAAVLADLSDPDPAALHRFLVEHGVSLTRMTHRHDTLEDVFLATTRDAQTEVAA